MLTFIRQLYQRWSNWCGDAEMEKAIRHHLSGRGYYGRSAKLRTVRLAAVQRPGWLQVYQFEATARLAAAGPADDGGQSADAATESSGGDPGAPAVYHELFGLVREDHRYNQTSVRVFASQDERRELFNLWSEGLVQLRGRRGSAKNESGC